MGEYNDIVREMGALRREIAKRGGIPTEEEADRLTGLENRLLEIEDTMEVKNLRSSLGNCKKSTTWRSMMEWLWLVICTAAAAVLLVVLLSGCCPCRHLQTATSTTDSVRVEVRDSIVERIDTAYVTLPVEVVRNVTRDTFSRVETSYAVSTAMVDTNGFLWHEIATKDIPVQVLTVNRTEWRDSIIYRDKVKEVRDVVQVKSEPTKWQKFQQRGFWVLLAFGATAAAIAGVRLWLKMKT